MSSTIKISNGDIDISPSTGMPSLVTGVLKCAQDVANVLMIDRIQPASNPSSVFSRPYGNELTLIQGNMVFSGVMGRPLVMRKIQEAINSLIEMQDLDPNITNDEHIDKINNILVDTFGYTDFLYYIEVAVKSGITIPAVTNLEKVKLDHQLPMTSSSDYKQQRQDRNIF